MNFRDTGVLLAYISAFDNRSFNEITASTWHELLHKYDLDECKAIVRQHFNESTQWLTPAHITQRLRALRRERLRAIGTIPRVNDTDAQRSDAHQVLKRVADAVASGRMSIPEYDTYLKNHVAFDSLDVDRRKELQH